MNISFCVILVQCCIMLAIFNCVVYLLVNRSSYRTLEEVKSIVGDHEKVNIHSQLFSDSGDIEAGNAHVTLMRNSELRELCSWVMK